MPIDDTVYFTERSVQTTSGNIGILDDVDTYLDFLVFSVAWGRISGSRWAAIAKPRRTVIPLL